MSKPLLGLLLGAVLGLIDGISAPWFLKEPDLSEVRNGMIGIIIGSTFKGLLAGLITGYVARKTNSLGWTLLVGIGLSAALAFLVAFLQGKFYLRITLPGAVLGAIVGYAVQRYGGPAARAAPEPAH
jgi:hypothetical protein